MATALDSSALLARHLDHPARPIVDEALAHDPDWCASALAHAESLAAVGQVVTDPVSADDLRAALRDDWARFHVVPVDLACLEHASELARQHPLRLVDAIHLAAAARLPKVVRYVTFEPAQIPVAQALGFEVIERVTREHRSCLTSPARVAQAMTADANGPVCEPEI